MSRAFAIAPALGPALTDDSLRDARCLVSGAGNVAIYTIEKLLAIGARPVTCSDSAGALYDPEQCSGFTALEESRSWWRKPPSFPP